MVDINAIMAELAQYTRMAEEIHENNGNKTLYFCLIWRCCNVRYYLFNIISFCSVG